MPCRIGRDDRRSLGEVRAGDRGQSTVSERGLHTVTGPHQQTAEQFGVQTVAQDRPRQAASTHEPFGRTVRQGETEVVAGTGEARVDDMADPVPRRGFQDGRVPPDHPVVLGEPGGDQYQGRYTGQVHAHAVVEVEPADPHAGGAAAARRRRTAGMERRQRG